MIPEVIARGAINKTLRCAVDSGGNLLPIIGGQSLNETPGQANVETVEFFLITESYPGADQPGQFQFGWRLVPGSPIDQLLIDAGRNKTPIILDMRNPGALIKKAGPQVTINLTTGAAGEKGLSEIETGDGNAALWDGNDITEGNIRVGNVIEHADEDEIIVVAAILCTDAEAMTAPKLFTAGRSAAKQYAAGANKMELRDPSVKYRVSGTGVSFSTDSSGIVPIGQLVMTVEQEPVYELIKHGEVDEAYEYEA